ncbi:MAG: hypothetical protein NTZ26_09770, partial [Candidatus Aminicenantes bacterium]|nr:hypothetical protein [Candidatus Aminicenantes bacterium]
GNAIGELELASKNIQDKIENSDDPKPSLGFAYADAYLKLCTSGFDLVDFVQEKIGASNAKALTVLDQMRRHTELGRSFLTSLKGLYIGVSQKEYGLALFNIVNIWNASMNFVIRESPPPSASALEPIRQSLSLTLFRYGSFIAAMANASDSDEMRKAIESVALPSGSYSVKRNSSFNVSLNAFVGLAPEWEWLSIRKEEGGFALNKNSRHGMLSVCAPIGIAVSHGCRSGASISLFASLIDPGALVAYRFTSLENQAPDFSLKNIFSPGLFFIWGLAHSPISLGLGTRLGPELRSITTDPQTGSLITDIRQKSWRILGMVSIDIPLLNFATR